MKPVDLFRHCPRCGGPAATPPGTNPFACSHCRLTYFLNPTVAAAAYIFDPAGRALFIRREKEPAKGKLAIPGGFIDYGETAEEALRREIHEEVGIAIERLAYLGSWTNEYPYQGVLYPVVDLIFQAWAVNPEAAFSGDAVADLEWRPITDVEPDELAFPSLRGGREVLLRMTNDE